jgi:death on curing protein
MEMFLVQNGFFIEASIGEQVDIMVEVASGKAGRCELTDWLRAHVHSAGFSDI